MQICQLNIDSRSFLGILHLFICTYNKEVRSLKKKKKRQKKKHKQALWNTCGTTFFDFDSKQVVCGVAETDTSPTPAALNKPPIRNQHQRTELVWSVKDYFKYVSFQAFSPFGRICLGIGACHIQAQASYCWSPGVMDLSLPAPVVYLAEVEKWEGEKTKYYYCILLLHWRVQQCAKQVLEQDAFGWKVERKLVQMRRKLGPNDSFNKVKLLYWGNEQISCCPHTEGKNLTVAYQDSPHPIRVQENFTWKWFLRKVQLQFLTFYHTLW